MNASHKSLPGSGAPGPPGRAPLSASALKAYAHPLRMRILRHLADQGPATATTLADALGESTGQTSYHLRQLARHGLVEDDPSRGTGRERWWRSRPVDVGPDVLDDPDTEPAARALYAQMLQDRTAALTRWASRREIPHEWRRSMHAEATLLLDATEMEQLTAEMDAVLGRFAAISRPRKESPDWHDRPRVRAYVDVFPLLPEE